MADDDELVRMSLHWVLKGEGHEVFEAVDGRDAVDKFTADPAAYDVLLLDLNMPKLGGDEAIREIKKAHPNVKAILVSGGADMPPQLPGVTYLQKPFENRELLDLIRKLLSQ